jgi:hypothetical protein
LIGSPNGRLFPGLLTAVLHDLRRAGPCVGRRACAGRERPLEAAAAGLMSAVTLMLVALLKNAELRAERALQTKLDAIATSLLDERRGHEGDAEGQLERSIGVHDEI